MNASVGFAWFGTRSSLAGEADYDDFASTTNLSDLVAATRLGAGLRIRVKGGRKPIAVDLGVERHQNGVAEFLTEGDIVDHPDGSVTLHANRSEANLMAFRVGISIGVPRDRDGRRR